MKTDKQVWENIALNFIRIVEMQQYNYQTKLSKDEKTKTKINNDA